ncbi:MAG: sulfatase-like hydrolase/transferase [Candidatus Aminicenantes bacterium]|nr:sulfatase-like hydrolase/transferase [Candidatus Aminicenantes bacterium]
MAKKKRSRRRKKKRHKITPPPESAAVSTAHSIKTKTAETSIKLHPRKSWIIGVVLIVIICTAALILFISPAKISIQRDSGLNVLLITLDTTRADRLGCYGYPRAKTPNLDSLAQKGVRFANVYCQVPLTLPSHCSIMAGTYPVSHNVHNNGTYYLTSDQLTLAEVLKARGFKTAAFVASFTVDSRFGLDQGFDVYDDSFQQGSPFKALNAERIADQVFAPFSAWLDNHHADQFFCWVHFFDPHLPYAPPPPYREDFSDSLYDGEISYMDSYVGEVVEKLKEKNILGQTLIILAGDHGEGLGDKVEIGHGLFLYDMVMKVPLIFYAENNLPGGKVIPSRVRLIDIMPSVLDMLDLEEADQNQGISLIPYIEGRKKDDLDSYMETFYPRENYGWSELTGLVAGNWKYIRAPKAELYNLKSDPNEDKNVLQSNTKIVSKMKNSLEMLIKNSAIAPGAGSRALTSEERERLGSLGYISYSDNRDKGEYPDPKDKIDELRMIQQAEMFESQGDYQAAAALHEKMLSLRPSSPSSYVNLALAQARLKKFDEAIQTLKHGIDKIPDSEILLARLGHTYFVTGQLNEAFVAMQQVLAINPRYIDALTLSAVIMDTLGKKETARDHYEKALSIEPENKFLRMSYALNLATGGKTSEAIDVYTPLTQEYPGEYSLYQYLGIAYGVAGDYAKSIENLKQAIGLHPTLIAYFNLAVALKETGEIAEAIHYLELYLEDPKGEDESKVKSARMELLNLKKVLK